MHFDGENFAMGVAIEPAVKKIIDGWEPQTRRAGLALRQLIFEIAQGDEKIGTLLETLKWGQPAYLTPVTGAGTTVRIDAVKKEQKIGLYFHCQTSLVSDFRQQYSDQLVFEKNRAIILDPRQALPMDVLAHCLAMALTYHLPNR